MIICPNMKQTGNMKGDVYSIINSSQPNCGSQKALDFKHAGAKS